LGWTALHIASAEQQYDVAEALLKAKANPNIVNSVGRTPVFYAAGYGNEKLVDLLIRNKADPSITSKGNPPTAIFSAAFGGHMKIVEKLAPRVRLSLNDCKQADPRACRDIYKAYTKVGANGDLQAIKSYLCELKEISTGIDCK
jgi:hypothetical protein